MVEPPLPATIVTAELLSGVGAAKPVALQSQRGVRGALNKVGFRFALSAAEQAVDDRRERIRRRLVETYRVAVISVKGGVGRTTTTAALGSTFAHLRPDRVGAVDASPHFGDLATRTRRHPYGLTLRDLARADRHASFAAVQAYLSINSADLATIAAPWSTENSQALTGQEYLAAADILCRHFSLLLIDCHTDVLDSTTGTVLQHCDAAVITTPATVSGLTGAAATLNWLGAHGYQRLVRHSLIAVVHQHPGKPAVSSDTVTDLFTAVGRPSLILPYDPHLAEGGEIDLRRLREPTRVALEELAAGLADEFPGFTVVHHDSADTDRGRS
ncbi:MinD/ParA family protein [Nocardia sp. 2]|uniref:MinD/ParA family protein n=1 Tax=Nocardia acididurans TaxID=2802282 RepID=A0ABS1MIB0_9NOCA|nr:MinD/ParA family protein [Nocardia acididurans]